MMMMMDGKPSKVVHFFSALESKWRSRGLRGGGPSRNEQGGGVAPNFFFFFAAGTFF